VVVVVAAAGAILAALGVKTGPTVILLAVIGGVAAVIEKISPEKESPRARAVRMVGVMFAVACLVGLGLITRPEEEAEPDPLAPERLFSHVPACAEGGCEITDHLTAGTGTDEVHVFGVQHPFGAAGVDSAVVLIVNPDGELRWKANLPTGFGIYEVVTDATRHIFIRLGVTNHSSVAWVLDLQRRGVRDFGTVGGVKLPVEGYSSPDAGGIRYLFASREGWPANEEPDALRDYFEWDGKAYRYAGCERIDFSQPLSPGPQRFPAGSARCPKPVNEYAVDMPGL
jgi:hypothetical protein